MKKPKKKTQTKTKKNRVPIIIFLIAITAVAGIIIFVSTLEEEIVQEEEIAVEGEMFSKEEIGPHLPTGEDIWNSALPPPEDTITVPDTGENYLIITFYNVTDKKITLFKNSNVPESLKHLQDANKHQEIWEIIVMIIPPPYIDKITSFEIATDSKPRFMGVSRSIGETDWKFWINIHKFYSSGTFNPNLVQRGIIHELAHLMVHNDLQIDDDLELANREFYSQNEYDKIIVEKTSECYPKFLTIAGCAKETSYMNQFFQKFWREVIYLESSQIENFPNEFDQEKFKKFFNSRPLNEFLSPSSINPIEDLSESFTAFVVFNEIDLVTEKRSMTAKEKLKFFFDIEEFRDVRNKIRTSLSE